MLILAIETSGRSGSVALLEDRTELETRQLDPQWRSARTLAPAIDQVLREARVQPAQVQIVAVTQGPGSFTGLRVGVTTAKTLAYALSCQVMGVDTLDAIAAQVEGPGVGGRELHAVLDAQRRELFLARFAPATGGEVPWQRLGPTELVSADDWMAQLPPGTLVTGPGLHRLVEKLPPHVQPIEVSRWEPSAATVGRLALAQWQAGRRDDLWKLVPTYIRPSYAEEKVHSPKPKA